MRIHLLVVEIVVAHRVCAEFGIVGVRCQHQRCAAAPAAHELGGQQVLSLGGVGVLAQVVTEHRHVFFESPVGHIAAVTGQHLRLGEVGHRSVLVGVAQDELAGFQWVAGSGCRLLAGALHHRLRQPVPETEVIVGVVERWGGVEVQVRQAAHPVGAGQQRVVVLDGPPALFVGAGEQDRDGMQVVTGQPTDPVLRGVAADVTEDGRPRDHALPERVRERGQRILGNAESAQTVPGERHRHPAVRRVHGGVHLGRRLHQLGQRGQPGPPAGGGVEGQELVAPGDGRGAGQQDVLDIVEFEHVTASDRACRRTRP